MCRNALILFFKYPEPGSSKTRIASVLGEDFTLELYRNMIRDSLSVADRSGTDTFIAWTGMNRESGDDLFRNRYDSFIEQHGIDLGERMHGAFSDVFDMGYSRAVLVGSDIPDLAPSIIQHAFDALDDHDLAFGPSEDGGYYLVACTRHSLDIGLFTGIHWSTPLVFSETLERVQALGLSIAQLDTLPDIDTCADLINYYKRTVSSSLKGKGFTAKFIAAQREVLYEKA